MNYQKTLDYISSVSWKGSVPGLSRIKQLMHLLGDPQENLRFIHIGGTNGKGSVAAFLSGMLCAAGYKTGLFISPYIQEFNERMQINRQNISDEELAEIATQIRPFADSMEDVPTEFELNTAIALMYFYRNCCDLVVWEVGMGGEFDATNVIPSPLAAVITAIGLDHMAYLGNTIEKIAATKAGIIKPGCQTVLYDQRYSLEGREGAADTIIKIIKERCREVGAGFYLAQPDHLTLLSAGLSGQTFLWKQSSAKDPVPLFIPLAAAYQRYNLAAALKTIEVLRTLGYPVSDEQIREGLSGTSWPGRFEVLKKQPVFLADGAHNPQGISAAVQSLRTLFGDKKLLIIFGVMADKDYGKMLDMLAPLAKKVFCTVPDNQRALSAEELKKEVQKRGIPAEAYPQVQSAVQSALREAAATDIICALGSLYMIGDVKTALKESSAAP